jgi:putative transposase
MSPFRHFNSSPEVIRLTVMMNTWYPLSLRQVEDLLFERGIDICHETVRFWWNRFGPVFATKIRKRRIHHRLYSNWCWHLDEVFARINGEMHYLRRVVEHEGETLKIFVTKHRDYRAALKFLKRAIKWFCQPNVIMTDRFWFYRAAMIVIGNGTDQECGCWLNNPAKNPHQPFRRWGRAMSIFRDVKTLQKFASVHTLIHNHFNLDRQLTRRRDFKQNRSAALTEWRQLEA